MQLKLVIYFKVLKGCVKPPLAGGFSYCVECKEWIAGRECRVASGSTGTTYLPGSAPGGEVPDSVLHGGAATEPGMVLGDKDEVCSVF